MSFVGRLKILGLQVLSIIVDSVFLAVWIIVQWGLDLFIAKFPLDGLAGWLLRGFQVLFGFATVVPVVMFVIVDLAAVIYRSKRDIRGRKDD